MISIRYFHPIGKKLYRTRSKSIESDRSRSTLIVVDRNIRGSPSDAYPGNPRISFQHQATRLRGDRQDLRRARAWAVWALVCSAKPKLLGDHSQEIDEPSIEEIAAGLDQHGHRKERALWQATHAC